MNLFCTLEQSHDLQKRGQFRTSRYVYYKQNKDCIFVRERFGCLAREIVGPAVTAQGAIDWWWTAGATEQFLTPHLRDPNMAERLVSEIITCGVKR